MLTIEYVGLSGLFSNVLMMLSLAELGIGEAIIFSMYGPIARSEKENILSLIHICLEHFRQCICDGIQSVTNADAAIRVINILEEADKSLEE